MAALAVLAAWGWFASRGGAPGGGSSNAPVARTNTQAEQHVHHENLAAPAPDAPAISFGERSANAVSAAGQAPVSAPEHDFDGTGRLRGNVRPPRGLDAPTEWTLVIAPAEFLVGGDRAVGRTLAFSEGENEFEAADLPLGGYTVRGQAFGLQTREQLVVLSGPDRTERLLQLQWEPTGILEGRVVDGRGEPLADVEILLVEGREPREDAVIHSGTTSATGDWLVDNLRDGEYTLYVHSLKLPLEPPQTLAFRAPAQRVDEIRLPEVYGQLTVIVRDPKGQPVGGARIVGYSNEGGRIEAETGADGVLEARHLTSGRYTIVARSELFGEVRGREHVYKNRTSSIELQYGR